MTKYNLENFLILQKAISLEKAIKDSSEFNIVYSGSLPEGFWIHLENSYIKELGIDLDLILLLFQIPQNLAILANKVASES